MKKINKNFIEEIEDYSDESGYYEWLSTETLVIGIQSVAYMLKTDGLDKETLIDGLYSILVLMKREEE